MKKHYGILIILVIILIIALFFINFSLKKEPKKITDNKNVSEKKEKTTSTSLIKEQKNMLDKVTVNYHASIRIEKNGMVIYFDPFKIENTLSDADYVFITHSHYDHYSEDDIKKVIKDETKFIVTSDLENKVSLLGISKDNIMVVYPNESHEIDNLKFDVIPAYNTNKTYHKKSYNWVGYNVNIDGTKYYVVGDSDVTEEFKNVKCDVIFVPVGGTYTMTDGEAANAINEMQPKYAVPIHYGETGSKDNALAFIKYLNDEIKGVILN